MKTKESLRESFRLEFGEKHFDIEPLEYALWLERQLLSSSVPTEIFSIFTCQTCRKMFVAVPGYLEKPLPCGHTPSVWAMASSVMDDLQDSEFVEWMYQNDLLDRPIKKLKQCGGDFVFHLAGQRRFKRPTKSMLGGFDDEDE